MGISTDLANAMTEEEVAIAINFLEGAVGVTPARIREFYELSKTEHPTDVTTDDFGAKWRHDDVVGKFEHFLRQDKHWNGGVDALWPFIKPYIEEAVDKTFELDGIPIE